MLEAQAFKRYAFNPDSNPMMHSEKDMSCKSNEVVMKNLDKNNRKQEKSNLKRSIRRRVEKVRNFRSSDMESDTGSDGLAVNSEGSGRSGDWGPPKIRRKSKSYRKRQETRTSLTDSGISLSKTDLESLSGLSINKHCIPEYRQLNSYQKILHNAYAQQQIKKSEGNKTSATEDSSLEHKSSEKGVAKYPPALSIQKTCDINEVKEIDSANNNEKEHFEADALNIEEKENAILEQCLKNEKLVNCEDNTRNYVVDCSDAVTRRQSRFPLPDHLNYPICRYRIKSESNNRVHPLKKLKEGWKKLRAKKLFHDKQQNSADTDCYPEFYPEYVVTADKEDDNETILSRLSRNPNQRKNFAKRVFERFGSKSYSINNNERFEDRAPRISRSGSTRSVPDALQDMWNKVHDKEDLPCEQSNHKVLHKVSSMPSIHSNVQKESLDQENYFSQLGKYAETRLTPNVHYHNSEKALTTGTDIADSLSGLQITQQDTDCIGKPDRKGCFNDNTANCCDDYKHQNDQLQEENKNDSLTRSSKKYSSCHELYQKSNMNQNAKYLVPQMYFQPSVPCACCMQGQQIPFMPFYPYPNYVYQVPSYGGYPPMDFVPNFYPVNGVQSFYPQNNEQTFHMVNGAHVQRPVDNVVPPLDVKIEREKMAEKRKIPQMAFDTFV